MKTSSKRKSLRGQHSPQPLHFEQLEPRQLLAADFQITEFLASNRTGLVNDNGNTSDWIEIYNAGTSTGSLAGYTLTDDATVSNLFTFPAVDVAAGRYLVVYADNDAAPGTGSDLYTGFKLSAGGEYLGLYDPSANVVSEFGPGGTDYPDQQTDASYGLAFGGGSITVPFQTGYFLAPTPGEPNGIQVTGFAAEVSSSTAAGFYDAPFQVTLVSDTPGATIRYTTDGSTPSATNGAIYTGPLSITGTTNLRAIANRPGYVLTQPDTWTYIFVDDVVEQSNDGSTPAGWPSNWAQGQSIGNQAQTTDYGIDPDVRNRTDSNGGDQNIKDALLAIPSWSITTDLDNLFGTTGIYTNALGDGREWERPASVELLNPDGTPGFQVDAGLRIRGGFSRLGSNPKHAFRLFFRSEYGDGNLEYPVHGDSGTDVFEKIDLRTAQNYSWSFNGNARNNFVIDRLNRTNQGDLGDPYTRSSWLHLYVNGQYWGLFETQERADANFGASYFGGTSDDYDVIKPDGGPGATPKTNIATDGNLDAYNALFQQARARAADGVTPNFVNDAAYLRAQGLNPDGTPNASFETLLDVDNVINYMTLILVSGNIDAPISRFFSNNLLNNYFAIRNRNGDEGFRFFIHDAEHTYLDADQNRNGPFNGDTYDNQVEYFNPQWLHQQLMANEEYRIRFADSVQAAFFNDGPLSTQVQLAKLDQLAAEIDSAIIAESARWGDSKRSSPLLRSDWLASLADYRSRIEQRNPIFLNQLRNTILALKANPAETRYNNTVAAPLFPNVDAPSYLINGINQHGGQIAEGSALRLAGSGGTIYYTTDGSDPRDVGGGINSSATAHNGSVNNTTVVSSGQQWRYSDTGQDLGGQGWQNLEFDDSAWRSGASELGYGDGDENTTVRFGTGANPDPDDKNITTYFRKQFNVSGSPEIATVRFKRDDGIAIYINGTEITRDNLPAGAIEYSTTAVFAVGGNAESQWMEVAFSPALLNSGTNTIAAEIHQANASSSDITFDAEIILGEQNAAVEILNSTTTAKARTLATDGTWSALSAAVFVIAEESASAANLRITEINYNPLNADAEFIEIQNITLPGTGSTIDLSGVTLINGPSSPFTIAAGRTLEPQQYGLIVKDLAAFNLANPDFNQSLILGEYDGSLSNGGEGITLVAADGSEIANLDYTDNDPWRLMVPVQALS